jgi:hypothetical protein
MKEEDILNAKIIAKNKGSTLEIKNEAPCYWIDKKKKHWQKFWCNDEGVLHQTHEINEEEVTRVCLPRKYIADALRLVHEEGHWGHKTIYEKICESYMWPGMWKDAKTFCATCDTCQKCNKGKQNVGKRAYINIKKRNELIGIDIFSGIPESNLGTGHMKILVVTDFLTRFTWLIPVPDTTEETVARVLLTTWFAVFGPSKKIITTEGEMIRS